MNHPVRTVYINPMRPVPELAPVRDQTVGPASRAGFAEASADADSSSATT
jgi:hypothetical protein